MNVRLVVIRLKREAVILRERERGWEGGGRGEGESAGHLCRFCPAVFQVGVRGRLYVLGLAGQDGSPIGDRQPNCQSWAFSRVGVVERAALPFTYGCRHEHTQSHDLQSNQLIGS